MILINNLWFYTETIYNVCSTWTNTSKLIDSQLYETTDSGQITYLTATLFAENVEENK